MTEAIRFLSSSGWMPCNPLDTALMDHFRIRDRYLERFSFAILDDATVARLLPFAPLLEIGAGSGYWSHEIKEAGGDIIASDPGTGRYMVGLTPRTCSWPEKWMPIEPLDALESIRKYPTRNLLIVWPDLDSEWPAAAIEAFSAETIIYVGEPAGGATGDQRFHALLTERFTLVEEIDIPQFWGLHDFLSIYRKIAN